MKIRFITFLSTVLAFAVSAQIRNSSFENHGVNPKLPANWGLMEKKTYSVALDSAEKRSGKLSVKISGTDSLAGDFQGISQLVNLQTDKMKRVGLSVYIRTAEVRGYVATWCQIWNRKLNKMVGFENIVYQQPRITGTGNWTKYTLSLMLDRGVDQLVFGGYLQGSGSVYFDDFTIEERSSSANPPTDSVKKYIDSFTKIVKENSLYRDSLNWKQIDQDVAELSIGMEKLEEARIIGSYILGKLKAAGDNHSFIQPKTIAKAYATGNTSQGKVSSELLAGGIGYLSIPAFGSTDQKTMDNFANDIQQRIRNMEKDQEIKGWIVDLRGNGGGNMHPMIAGLGPLTGEGILGYFVYGTAGAKKYSPWSYKAIKNNRKHTLGVNLTNPYKIKNRKTPVAVLIGPRTGSSGEMTAMSFIGKPGVRLFGQPSAGFTTSNQSYPLSDGSMLLLATSITADRNKKEFMPRIQPDEIVSMEGETDKTRITAIDWVNKSGENVKKQ